MDRPPQGKRASHASGPLVFGLAPTAARVGRLHCVLGYHRRDGLRVRSSNGARRLLAELGEDEYLRQWVNHPFPTDLLVKIEDALRS